MIAWRRKTRRLAKGDAVEITWGVNAGRAGVIVKHDWVAWVAIDGIADPLPYGTSALRRVS